MADLKATSGNFHAHGGAEDHRDPPLEPSIRDFPHYVNFETKFHVGYIEHKIPVTHGETEVSIWQPMKHDESIPRLEAYEHVMDWAARVRLFKGPKSTLVANAMSYLPHSDATMPLPSAVHKLPEGNPAPLLPPGWRKALIVFAHGFTDDQFDIYRAVERLAGLGFIVAAPVFSDSAGSDRFTVSKMGEGSTGAAVVLRMHTIDHVIAFAKTLYPGIEKVGMIGYSLGTDTLRMHPMTCPRAYLAGPGWTKTRDPAVCVPPRPEGPTMMLSSNGDDGPPKPPISSDHSGIPYDQRAHLTPAMLSGDERIPEHSIHVYETVPHVGYVDRNVTEVDEKQLSAMTWGFMSFVPTPMEEIERWTEFNSMALLRFFDQFL